MTLPVIRNSSTARARVTPSESHNIQSEIQCSLPSTVTIHMDQAISTKDDHVQRIRITSHGQIKAWVAFSLQFLLEVSAPLAVDGSNFEVNREPPTLVNE